jgi:hypothetical protein
MRATATGLPLSIDSIWANSSLFCSISSASFYSILPRSEGDILPHGRNLPAGEPGRSAHRSGYYFPDAETDPRISDNLAIPGNQRRK